MAMAITLSVVEAHKYTSMHRDAIEASELCVCGYCHEHFPPSQIQEWTDWLPSVADEEKSEQNGQTAICPHCSVDAVLPDSMGLDLSPAFLARFHEHWF
jgi:hypothetical protein